MGLTVTGTFAGTEHNVVLRIGFLSSTVRWIGLVFSFAQQLPLQTLLFVQMDALLPLYSKVYDVLILYDGSMAFVSDVLRRVLKGTQ
jgi:hypothetical protein